MERLHHTHKRCETWRRKKKKKKTLDLSFIWPQKSPRGDSGLRIMLSKERISHTKLFPVLWGKAWQEQWPEKEKCKLDMQGMLFNVVGEFWATK